MIGFLGTAWFGVNLVVLQYFIAFDPSKDQFVAGNEQANSSSEPPYVPNAVDVVTTWPSRKIKEALRRRGKCKGWLHKYLVERPAWRAALKGYTCITAPQNFYILTNPTGYPFHG